MERLARVHIYGSGRFFVASIESEHTFAFLGALAKVVIGSLLETATHRVIVDAEVEYLGEVAQKAIAIPAASTDEQHFWFRAFEFADSSFLVPHGVVVMTGPTSEPGIRVGVVLPGTVGTDGRVPASDQFLVDRRFTGSR